jgi:hypothetical protein
MGDLDQIRADASVTRDSLLTDEEKEEDIETSAPQPNVESTISDKIDHHDEPLSEQQDDGNEDEPALDPDQRFLITALLNGQPYEDYCKQHHIMVSILVDAINDQLFDWIGDSVIEFDDQDQPQIVEDYRPDIQELLKEDK